MSERQISELAGALTRHQHHFGQMPTDDRQWIIQNTEAAIGLFAAAVKNRVVAPVKQLLERLSASVAVPAVKDFTAKEHFVVDTSKKAKVKISYLGNNLKKNFLPKVESDEVAAEELAINKLLEYAYDPAIITALGGEAKVEISLGQFFAAFAKQPNGEKGALLTNGYANIGYVRDIEGVLWAVSGELGRRWLALRGGSARRSERVGRRLSVPLPLILSALGHVRNQKLLILRIFPRIYLRCRGSGDFILYTE